MNASIERVGNILRVQLRSWQDRVETSWGYESRSRCFLKCSRPEEQDRTLFTDVVDRPKTKSGFVHSDRDHLRLLSRKLLPPINSGNHTLQFILIDLSSMSLPYSIILRA